MEVAALFVAKDGCYSGLSNVDAWHQERDARLYDGSLPVVAHPPCKLWSKFAKANYIQWGGEHNKPGNDGGCFAFALEAVRKNGGVLEHPARTTAWREFGLKAPTQVGWQNHKEGWVCEVWQSAYGHRAAKATWLYYCGFSRPQDLRWERFTGTHQIGKQDGRGKSRNKPTLSKREAEATPLEFRDALIRLALQSRVCEIPGARADQNQFLAFWNERQLALKMLAQEFCKEMPMAASPQRLYKKMQARAAELSFTGAELSEAVQAVLQSNKPSS